MDPIATTTAPEAPAAAPAAAPAPVPAAVEIAAPEAPTLLGALSAETAPDYSALALPEGATADPATMDAFKAVLGEHKLPTESAQKLLDLHLQTLQAQQQQMQQTVAGWAQQVGNDPEIGGSGQEQALGLARQALDTYGSPELISVLNDTGLGNHPAVIRAFYRMGKAIAEDGRKGPSHGVAPDPLRALYPTMFKD
ncbi:hypothetical protein [Insolitispirillum peregrinum]|uniref:Peptidase n=1 Tax=Insolitispirillum peregrinum TaxID=80876 RepID=A0A1N7LG42_9PROT|nr:hypothetical protein [Insolitispirillum peregrinum]SIS72785.1 hypothetical protein SAMN05421779_103308 [Insolitispirillum peregrinum]